MVGKPTQILGAVEFADAPGGTTVTGRFELRPHGLMKVMLPLMAGTVRRDFAKQLANFGRFCEEYVDTER